MIMLVADPTLNKHKISFVKVISSLFKGFPDVLVPLFVFGQKEHDVATTSLVEQSMGEVFVHF